MYALRQDSAVYHLIDPATNRTVCGLKFIKLRVKSRAALSYTPTRPLNKTICKHCVRLSEPKRAKVQS